MHGTIHCTPPPFVAGDPSRSGAAQWGDNADDRWPAGSSDREAEGSGGAGSCGDRPGLVDQSASARSEGLPAVQDGSSPAAFRRGSRIDVGLDAVRRDAVVIGREPAADRDPHAAVVVERAPDLDRVLAVGGLADDRRPAMLLERRGDDLRADAEPPLISTTTGQVRVGREPVAGRLPALHASRPTPG